MRPNTCVTLLGFAVAIESHLNNTPDSNEVRTVDHPRPTETATQRR